MSRKDVDNLREHGFDDRDILDLAQLIVISIIQTVLWTAWNQAGTSYALQTK
jgi:hypothetical protein